MKAPSFLNRDQANPSALVPLILAFAAVYFIWGSTYLAIIYALETLPPFLMAGLRFVTAGSILYLYARLKGEHPPSGIHWLRAAIIGGLLLLLGNGNVVWAEQKISSGVAALLITTEPLWVILLEWIHFRKRPAKQVWLGVVLGFAGMFVLVGLKNLDGSGLQLAGVAAIIVATLAWASGSVYSARADLPSSPVLTTGMQMLAGGLLLSMVGLLHGDFAHFNPAQVSARSWLALGYLTVFGSLIGFTSYIWLTRVQSPSRVATYAYVNPVIAVLLGWFLGGEPLTGRLIFAALILVSAVICITTSHSPSVETITPEEVQESQELGSLNPAVVCD